MILSTLKFLLFFVAVCVVLPSPCFAQNKSGDPLVEKIQKENQRRQKLQDKKAEKMREKVAKIVAKQEREKAKLEREKLGLEDDDSEDSSQSTSRLIKAALVVAFVIGCCGVKLLMGALGEDGVAPVEDVEEVEINKIKTRCLYCKKGYRVNIKKVGQIIKCKQCGNCFTVTN